jgi:hypothetical protein
MTRRMRHGCRPTGLSEPRSRCCSTCSPASAFALIAAAAALITRLPLNAHTGLMWGLAGLRHLHAGALGRPAARASGHGKGRSGQRASLVVVGGGGDRRRHRADRAHPPLAWKAAAIALIALPHVIGAPQARRHQRRSGRPCQCLCRQRHRRLGGVLDRARRQPRVPSDPPGRTPGRPTDAQDPGHRRHRLSRRRQDDDHPQSARPGQWPAHRAHRQRVRRCRRRRRDPQRVRD